MKTQLNETIESMPLRYFLLFDGDNRGWKTGIECVLQLSISDSWKKHNITDDDRDILQRALNGDHHLDYWSLIEDFIDMARCHYQGVEYCLNWIDGSIFAVPVELNAHECIRLYGEE